MKNFLLFISIAVLLSACSTQKFVSSTKGLLEKYEPQATVEPLDSTTYFEASIQNLYPTEGVKGVAPKSQLIWDISEAWIKIKGEAKGRLEKDKLIDLYKAIIGQINIWKK